MLSNCRLKHSAEEINNVTNEVVGLADAWLNYCGMTDADLANKLNRDDFVISYYALNREARCALYNGYTPIGEPFISNGGNLDQFKADLSLVLYRFAVISGSQKTYDYITKFLANNLK